MEFTEENYVFLFCSAPAGVPLSLFLHTWFVVKRPGQPADRFGVYDPMFTAPANIEAGHLHKNLFPLFQGLAVLATWPSGPHFSGTIVASLEGEEGSLAQRMVERVYQSYEDYPARDVYRMFSGPNSNTYTAWLLNQFPEANITLPSRAYGKGFVGRVN